MVVMMVADQRLEVSIIEFGGTVALDSIFLNLNILFDSIWETDRKDKRRKMGFKHEQSTTLIIHEGCISDIGGGAEMPRSRTLIGSSPQRAGPTHIFRLL